MIKIKYKLIRRSKSVHINKKILFKYILQIGSSIRKKGIRICENDVGLYFSSDELK